MTNDKLLEEVAEAIAEKAKVVLTEVRGYGGTLVYEPMLANEDEIAQAAIDVMQKQIDELAKSRQELAELVYVLERGYSAISYLRALANDPTKENITQWCDDGDRFFAKALAKHQKKGE